MERLVEDWFFFHRTKRARAAGCSLLGLLLSRLFCFHGLLLEDINMLLPDLREEVAPVASRDDQGIWLEFLVYALASLQGVCVDWVAW